MFDDFFHSFCFSYKQVVHLPERALLGGALCGFSHLARIA